MNSEPTPNRPEPATLLPSLEEQRLDWRAGALGAGIVLLALLGVYWPALRGQFLWDDYLVVHQNPLLTGKADLGSIWLRTDFPLSSVVLWLQWQAWGDHPAGYHIVNLLLHATSALLLWRVLARLRVPAPWLAAMLFAVHPMCVASVAWIAELKNTLSLPFFLLSLLWYLRHTSCLQSFGADCETWTARGMPHLVPPHPGPLPKGEGAPLAAPLPTTGDRFTARQAAITPLPKGEGRGEGEVDVRPPSAHACCNGLSACGLQSCWYWLSLLAFLLALASKTSTVMLPVVLLGCAWWQRGRITWRDVLRVIPFFALALMFGLMSIWFQAQGAISGVTVQSENLWGRLAGAGMALWFYLGKALLPLHLNMIYPRWKIDAGVPTSYLPLLLWLGLLGACWPFRRTWGRHVLFGLGSFAVLLFPVSGFFDMFYLTLSRVSDHFGYLPLVAVVALVAGGLGWGARGRALWSVGAGLVLGLALLATVRARVFVSEEALWRDTLAKNNAAWAAHANLGWILASQQKYDEARAHLEASLALRPANAQARANLGRLLALQGKRSEAEAQFQEALRLKPKDADIRKTFAAALAEQGRKQEAVTQLQEVLRVRQEVEVQLQLATLLQETGKSAEAVAEYQQVLKGKPDQPEALNNLAWLLATSANAAVRNGAAAIPLAERACRLSGDRDSRALGTLAAAYAEAGRFSEAVLTAQKSVEAATASGDAQLAQTARQLLQLFRSGKPYHEPPSKSQSE